MHVMTRLGRLRTRDQLYFSVVLPRRESGFCAPGAGPVASLLIIKIGFPSMAAAERHFRPKTGESFLRRFVRISRPRPDSTDWFYVETANGSGAEICRPNLPVSVASGPNRAVSSYSLVSRPELSPLPAHPSPTLLPPFAFRQLSFRALLYGLSALVPALTKIYAVPRVNSA